MHKRERGAAAAPRSIRPLRLAYFRIRNVAIFSAMSRKAERSSEPVEEL